MSRREHGGGVGASHARRAVPPPSRPRQTLHRRGRALGRKNTPGLEDAPADICTRHLRGRGANAQGGEPPLTHRSAVTRGHRSRRRCMRRGLRSCGPATLSFAAHATIMRRPGHLQRFSPNVALTTSGAVMAAIYGRSAHEPAAYQSRRQRRHVARAPGADDHEPATLAWRLVYSAQGHGRRRAGGNTGRLERRRARRLRVERVGDAHARP